MKSKQDVMKSVSKKLDHYLIIKKRNLEHADADSDQEWTTYLSLWAEKNGLWGDEYYSARAIGEEKTFKFTVRSNPLLKEVDPVDYQLIYDNKAFDIKHMDFIPGNEWVVIKAMERESYERN